MKTLFITIALLSLTSIGLAVGSRGLSQDDLETQNLQTVRASVALCSRGKCSPCGTFSYEGQRVVYTPSLCELNQQTKEAQDDALMIDALIREKYLGTDAGHRCVCCPLDAGTDGGHCLCGAQSRELPREDPTEVLS
jgi:hypothetical protein